MHPLLLNTNISQSTSTNPLVYSYAWTPYYGWYGQGETYGSQNGLTYLFPMVSDQVGVWGPSRAALDAGNFPTTYAQSIAESSWPGCGIDKWTSPYDIDWNTYPLNSATGYIGFTFGNTGHIGYTSINEMVAANRWIPKNNRVYRNDRHGRAITSGLCGYNRGIGYELIYGIPSSSDFGTSLTQKPLRTPWVKRKFNFIRKELQNIMSVMGNTGFYLNGMETDDEYYIFWDFRSIGPSATFADAFMYPNNTASGNCWYASYTGSSAAPDYLVNNGIASFRSYLLTHGFTTNTNSSKFVDGLTAAGAAINTANNIAISGSRSQSIASEYSAALTDWMAMHWRDYAEDFKTYNGICADNSFIANYGYYRTNVGIRGYTDSSLENYFTGLLNQNANDYIPYPDTTPPSSSVNDNKTKYYAYNYLSTNHSPGNVQREVSNNLDSIYPYGGIMGQLKVEGAGTRSIDRKKLFYGNSYSYGSSFGIYTNYNWQISQILGLNNEAPIWWLPANYLNSNAPGQTLKASNCYEVFGLSAAKKYDLTGILGSSFGTLNRCGDNKAPQWNSWFLNPVWGITAIDTNSYFGPANYIPFHGPYGLNGLSLGAISLSLIGTGKTWTTDMLDSSGFPYPGNTLPAGTLYKHYWSHWYPMAFMALIYDVNWGRQVAVGNVYRAVQQRLGTYPGITGSLWNGIQRPINVWIQDEKLYLAGDYASAADNDLAQNLDLIGAYFEPTGITQGYHVSGSTKTLVTQYIAEAGVMYYENIRHQYLNKAGRYTHWNPYMYSCVTSATGGQVMVNNKGLPELVSGLTMYGVCGAITMRLGRKLNTVLADCNTRGNGMVYQTVYLAPGNDSERSYLMSGAQKIDGNYLWRITFANPATDPSPIIIRGACSGITTAYNISGVTDYINNPNNKFGVWWTTGNYEVPIVDNPPIPEALRLGVANLPENPKIMYNATKNPESRNAVPYGYKNPDLFCNMGPIYGYWNQTEQWSSQNGLSYMWPQLYWGSGTGRRGPLKSDLNNGIFPNSSGAGYNEESTWYGVGGDVYPNVDIDMSTAPWNSSTGYIGLTFGATGFITATWANEWILDRKWIPNKYRVFYPGRSWRAIDNSPLNGTEIIGLTGDLLSKQLKTPWLKRKINFMRAELKAFYLLASATGFTMAHWECDDEYYGNLGDFRGIGISGTTFIGGQTVANPIADLNFYNQFLYPNNSPTGNSWYASFFGSSAAPDTLIARGITTMERFLLTKGFDNNGSAIKPARGLTAVGNYGISGNIAMGGSPDQFIQNEYVSALKDWLACMYNDLVIDFKQYNGICADNSLSGNYGYYKTNSAAINYQNPSYRNPSNNPYITDLQNRGSTDYIPYPHPLVTNDPQMTNYYSYNDQYTLDSAYNVFTEQVGDIGDIHPYGGIVNLLDHSSNSYTLLDRNLDYRGNSYGFVTNGITFGKNNIGWYTYQSKLSSKFGSNSALYNSTDAKKWLPANYLGTNFAGQLITCKACAEILGNCGFFKFDPTGSHGSSAANPIKVGFDRAPLAIGWHLNPVWGITPQRFNGGATIGPANFVPHKGLHHLNGLTVGAYTITLLGDRTSWADTENSLDSCGNPFPGNTIPPGSIYKNYWTNWYPIAFLALMSDVKWGRQVAKTNVSTAIYQRKDPTNHPKILGSEWYGIQKPINTWIANQLWQNDSDNIGLDTNVGDLNQYFVPTGISFGYYSHDAVNAFGITYMDGEAGPMYYENIRHQYLNKTGRYQWWNPTYWSVTDSNGKRLPSMNAIFPRRFDPIRTFNPQLANGLTSMGVCGSIMMNLGRKINNVIGECNTLGNGIIWETVYLAPMNMDERSYLISGAQKVDGNYLWRITFAHPATQSPINIVGSVSGITTSYNINGVTDYINNPNSKFGVWWTSDRYEIPVVVNPPISEAERLNVLNLPENPAFEYDPLTMTEANPRPKINAFAYNWPFDTGSDTTTLNNWAANVNLFNYVSPLVFFTQRTLNDDWKDGIG
jgi:hypothetical protein